MRLITIYLFLIITSGNLFPQWFLKNQIPKHHFYAIDFIDQNTGWAVGNYGTVYKTTNSGDTWIIQSSQTIINLTGVSFTDENNGTVVGNYSIILRTTNGGDAWFSQSSGVNNWLTAVSFTDVNNGTAVGLTVQSLEPQMVVIPGLCNKAEHKIFCMVFPLQM